MRYDYTVLVHKLQDGRWGSVAALCVEDAGIRYITLKGTGETKETAVRAIHDQVFAYLTKTSVSGTEERIQDLEVLVRDLIKPQDGPYFQPSVEDEERLALARGRLRHSGVGEVAATNQHPSDKTMLVLRVTPDGRANVTVEQGSEVTAIEIGEIAFRIGPRGRLTRENLIQLAEDLREAAEKL